MLQLETEENDKKLKLGSQRLFEKVMLNRENEEQDKRRANMQRIQRGEGYFYSLDTVVNPELLRVLQK